MSRTVWHGTRQESLELLHAVRQHCSCETERGLMLETCAAHRMLARDQRALNGLLFMRRMAERLLAEEFELADEVEPVESQPRAPRASNVSRAILM
jgi:hypothetical protein